jgi:hypothetical protein
VWDTAKSAAGTARIGMWSHVTATYQASTKKQTIYVDDRVSGTATHTTPWSAAGSFRIGTMRTNATTLGNDFKGQVADVQTWNTVVNPDVRPTQTSIGEAPEIAYDNGGATMRMFRWVSDGTSFDRTTDYNSGGWNLANVGDRMASGDVDGDGHDDVVQAYQLSNGTFAFYVIRYGNSAVKVWYTSGAFDLTKVAGRLVMGDFNGDGKAEPALVYDNGNGTMSIYHWVSDGTSFQPATTFVSGFFSLADVGDRVAAGDIDGDGKDDIVMAYQLSNGTFSFYTWKGGTTLTVGGIWYTSGAFDLTKVGGRMVLGDFNGDGKAEPALAYDLGGTMRIYRWQSDGTSFARTTDYNSGAFSLADVGDRMAAGDIDNDGKDDIVMAYQLSNGAFSFYTWKNGNAAAQIWYTYSAFDLTNVAGRLVLGHW